MNKLTPIEVINAMTDGVTLYSEASEATMRSKEFIYYPKAGKYAVTTLDESGEQDACGRMLTPRLNAAVDKYNRFDVDGE